MNITATHHRFAIRLLLLSLALLTPSVSGSQTPAPNSDGSSSADTATCKSPESNLEEIEYPSRLKAAITMALQAKERDEAGSPLTGEVYLFAARELLNCLLFEADVLVKGPDLGDPAESEKAAFLLDECLEGAEKNDADRTAVGAIYYGIGLMYLKYTIYYRAEGDESVASKVQLLILDYMQKARDRGDARAEAFLKAIEK